MALQLQWTNEVATNGFKCLIYGCSGAGKTRLASTAPAPVILAPESGLLSLQEYKLPYFLIKTVAELIEAYHIVISPEWSGVQTIIIDSITEIAEVLLADLKKKHKDPRKAYGDVQDEVAALIRMFIDIQGKHVVMTAKESYDKDGVTGGMKWQPMMPGNKLPQALPYFFDEVFRLVPFSQADPTTGQMVTQRFLQTAADNMSVAKDRSGKLATPWEVADLSHCFAKMAS